MTPARAAQLPRFDASPTASGPRVEWVLAIHLCVWVWAAWITRANLSVHQDMVENYFWGIEWQAGYYKHPPLFAWVTAAWFSLFPRTDFAYFLLSMANVTLGLYGVHAVARRFLQAPLAACATMALAISPLYTGLAIKFNANAILLSLWPWTVFFFVRVAEKRRWPDAIAFGVMAALSLLGKYFSGVLLISLLLTTAVHAPWRSLWKTHLPWLALATAVLMLLPHAQWVVANDYTTLRYAEQRGTSGKMGAAALRFVKYSLAQFLYLTPGWLLLLWAVVPGQRRLAVSSTILALRHPRRDLGLWLLSFMPLAVAGALSLISRTEMPSIWGMAQWSCFYTLIIVALSSGRITVDWSRAVRGLRVYWLLVAFISPALGLWLAHHPLPEQLEARRELAVAAQEVWNRETGVPLAIVAGDEALAGSVTFYASGKVRYWDGRESRITPWITLDDVKRQGALMVCRTLDPICNARGLALTSVQRDVTVQKRWLGVDLPAETYRVFVGLPAT